MDASRLVYLIFFIDKIERKELRALPIPNDTESGECSSRASHCSLAVKWSGIVCPEFVYKVNA